MSEIFEQMNYGLNVQGIVETDDCKVMRLNDSSGDGTMTLYQVFPGVFLMYNDAFGVKKRIFLSQYGLIVYRPLQGRTD